MAKQNGRRGSSNQGGQQKKDSQRTDARRGQPGRRQTDHTLASSHGRSTGSVAAGSSAGASVPVALHGEYIADMVGIGHEGEGVGRVDGFTLFVPGALPGERARVRVTGLHKNYGRAELLEVLQSSPDRQMPACPVFDECGGCQLQHLDYAAQLRWKRQMVIDSMERIGKLHVADETSPDGSAEGVGGVIVHPVIGMDEPWRYRNKVQVPIGEREGGLVGGFYAAGSHRIVDTDECLIRHESGDTVTRNVKQIASKLGVAAYDEETGRGHLRHVVVKTGYRTGEVMVVLVTGGEELPQANRLAEEIVRAVPGVASVCHNVNPGRSGTVMGDKTTVLWGRDRIYDRIGDVEFAISAQSFYQVNPVQTEILYGKALEYAGLTGEETVIDAYCGVGTISLFLAQRAKQVYGVEVVREAVEDARRNAELNAIANVEFEAGLAEETIPAWRERGIVPDVIVVDPPRKGCDAALLETIVVMRPRRVVYVSCNPSTLARDLRVLEDGGFRAVEVQPVDMFPHTTHVEVIVRLERKDTVQ